MTVLYRATTELVAQAWLRSVLGDIVATKLPEDNTGWAGSGFVVIATTGGNSGMYVPLRSPVVSLNCWAVNPSSGKPPWGKAAQLTERVLAACLDLDEAQPIVTLPSGYARARVMTAYPEYEPRRVPDDPASYARFDVALTINWVEVAS